MGGLPSTITETDLRNFFSKYGEVCEVVIMYDQEKKKSRGFGFLSFETEAARERAVADHFVMIQNKQVSIDRTYKSGLFCQYCRLSFISLAFHS